MGRLIAAVVALAVFVAGAMYWSQAEQAQTMPAQPLCPGVTCPASTEASTKKDCAGGCPCCKHHDAAKADKAEAKKDAGDKGDDGYPLVENLFFIFDRPTANMTPRQRKRER